MVKKLLLFVLPILAVLLVLAVPAYAVSVTNALYRADLVATNTGDAITSGVAAVCDVNTAALISGEYVTDDLLNTAIQTTGGIDIAYMPGVETNPWVFWFPSIGTETKCYNFYAGGPAMQTGFAYFPGAGGMTTADNDTSLELGNNFKIEQQGYVDTSAGSDKNLAYKKDTFEIWVSGDEEIATGIFNSFSGFSSTSDGYVYATNVAYATAQAAASGTVSAGATTFGIGQRGNVDNWPTVAAVNGGNDTVDQTSHTVNLPANIVSGNLLLVFFGSHGVPTITFPGDWTQLFQTANSSIMFGAWYKVANGTEGATITVTTSNVQETAHTSYRITDYQGVPQVGTSVGAYSSLPDPPSLTPSWGAQNTLWFAACGYDANRTVSVYPTNYSSGRNDYANNSTGCGVGTARRVFNTASENPGTFTITADSSWVSNTIAILGGYEVDRGYVYFDTSAIPDGAEIASATLYLFGQADNSTTDFDISINSGMPTYPTNPLAAGDFQKTYYTNGGGSLSTSVFLYTPVVQGRSTGASAAVDTTSHAITLPGGIVAGELLLVIFSVDGNLTCSDASGLWTLLGQTTYVATSSPTEAIFYKIATGGDTLTITTSAAEQSSHIALRISGAGVPTATAATGDSINSDPPNHNPAVSRNYLWVATRTGDSTVVATIAPANYGNLQSQASAGANGASTNTAERSLFASSENPDTYTSATEQWVSYTISVPVSGVYNAIPLSATGLTWINKTGTTKFCLRSSRDIAITAPTGSEYVTVYSSEQTGTANDPYLVVNYWSPSVTAEGIESSLVTVIIEADGTDLTIEVYDADDVLIDSNTTALGGASVPNNSNNWSFLTNGSMPYMVYQKIWIGGTAPANLKQHIVYERDTTFDDLTTNNNDATPTFRTTSGDPDVTVSFQNFRPIEEATYSGGAGDEETGMLTGIPEEPEEMYGGEGGGSENIPGAEWLNPMLEEANIPTDFFWIVTIYGLAAVFVVGSYQFIRSSLLFPAIAGFCVILFFALVTKGDPIPLWTIFPYILNSAGFLVMEKTFGW